MHRTVMRQRQPICHRASTTHRHSSLRRRSRSRMYMRAHLTAWHSRVQRRTARATPNVARWYLARACSSSKTASTRRRHRPRSCMERWWSIVRARVTCRSSSVRQFKMKSCQWRRRTTSSRTRCWYQQHRSRMTAPAAAAPTSSRRRHRRRSRSPTRRGADTESSLSTYLSLSILNCYPTKEPCCTQYRAASTRWGRVWFDCFELYGSGRGSMMGARLQGSQPCSEHCRRCR